MPLPAIAHSFGSLYTLPVPVWLYVYGATAALALSFLIIGYFVTTPAQAKRNFSVSRWRPVHAPVLVTALQLLSVGLLALTIISGLIGSNNSYLNFNMTFFWIIILLLYTYWVAVFGNSYNTLNPWQIVTNSIDRAIPNAFSGRRPYPPALAYYPALLLYMALIWIELFGKTKPLSLSLILIAYSAINFLGAWWWGSKNWFHYGDLFSVFFRVMGKLAPLEWSHKGVRLRQPFIGLLDQPCRDLSLLLFILFMLSSTAYDGLHETELWRNLSREVSNLCITALDTTMRESPILYSRIYRSFQGFALLISPFIYLAIYLALLFITKKLTRTDRPLYSLALELGYSLVPIAFVYNLSHYFTLGLFQGPRIFRLASDPFGYHWNLFGTQNWFVSPIMIAADTVWIIQVGLILIGHIISVYLMHLVALRVFNSGRMALISQIPLLALMMLYTASGLWILSLPIQS
ncbi:hypothetical protein [Zhongshania sp.]|uniref:hypothetical protein n=1 Tax=Zhongshania sp. TaxID=1971902 RepID=UPI003565D9F4